MNPLSEKSKLQKVVKEIENLSREDQKILFQFLECQLENKLPSNLAKEIEEVRQEYQEGNFKFGSVNDFFKELDT